MSEDYMTMSAASSVLSGISAVTGALVTKLTTAPQNRKGIIEYLEKDIEFTIKQKEDLRNLVGALKKNVKNMNYTEIKVAMESLDNLYKIIPFKSTRKIIDKSLNILIDNERRTKKAQTKVQAEAEAKRQAALIEHAESKILLLWEGKFNKAQEEWTNEEREQYAEELKNWNKEFFGIKRIP